MGLLMHISTYQHVSAHVSMYQHFFVPLLGSMLCCQVRLYDVLFKSEAPDALGDSWLEDLNKESLEVVQGAFVHPHLAQTAKVCWWCWATRLLLPLSRAPTASVPQLHAASNSCVAEYIHAYMLTHCQLCRSIMLCFKKWVVGCPAGL
jgi:hypothetical protein